MQRLRISVDATHQTDVIGIAACMDGRDVRPLFMDVVNPQHGDNMAAEWMALTEAMRIAHKANFPSHIEFLTDCSGIAATVYRDTRTKDFLASHPDWTVRHIPRIRNVAAHTLASQAVKCWRAGKDGSWTMGGASRPLVEALLPLPPDDNGREGVKSQAARVG